MLWVLNIIIIGLRIHIIKSVYQTCSCVHWVKEEACRFLEIDYLSLMSSEASPRDYFWIIAAFFRSGRVLNPALNGYPSLWQRHLCFDVSLSFNYRKRLLHLPKGGWGAYSECLSLPPPVGGSLDVNSIALRLTAAGPDTLRQVYTALVPWTFYVRYARRSDETRRAKKLLLTPQLLIKPQRVPWCHPVGICVCLISEFLSQTSLSNKNRRRVKYPAWTKGC